MKYVVIGICLLEQVLLGTVVSAVCSLDEYTWLPIEWGTLGDSVSYAGDFAVYDGRLIASVNYANTVALRPGTATTGRCWGRPTAKSVRSKSMMENFTSPVIFPR
jgi:hypothetical protein